MKNKCSEIVEPLTISIGITMYSVEAKVAADLISAADKALYQAKNTRRNKVVLYEQVQ